MAWVETIRRKGGAGRREKDADADRAVRSHHARLAAAALLVELARVTATSGSVDAPLIASEDRSEEVALKRESAGREDAMRTLIDPVCPAAACSHAMARSASRVHDTR
jgi:hypothetical protein